MTFFFVFRSILLFGGKQSHRGQWFMITVKLSCEIQDITPSSNNGKDISEFEIFEVMQMRCFNFGLDITKKS